MNKKSFLSLFMMACISLPMAADVKVATFENEDGGIQLSAEKHAWHGAEPLKDGANEWKSGDFGFYTYQDATEWGKFYYGFIASNEKENTSTGMAEPYRSAAGGAAHGDNFAIWTNDYYGTNGVAFSKAKVAGFFVNNNAYTVTSMCNGDDYAKKFGKEDWLNLLCIGKVGTNNVDTVKVALAADGKYIDKWTFVDLSALGEVEAVIFAMESSDASEWGMNTPAYFCLDDFGASKPADYVAPEMAAFPSEEGIENVNAEAVSASKIMLNGELYIVRDGAIYTIRGNRLK